MDKQFDVIIIGSGAGGGTLARHLAPSGKSILILERGDWLKREALNWDATAVFPENRYVSPDTWYDARGGRSSRRCIILSAARPNVCAALFRLRRRISEKYVITMDSGVQFRGIAALHQAERAHVHGLRGGSNQPRQWPASVSATSYEPRIQQLFDDIAAGTTIHSGAQRD